MSFVSLTIEEDEMLTKNITSVPESLKITLKVSVSKKIELLGALKSPLRYLFPKLTLALKSPNSFVLYHFSVPLGCCLMVCLRYP